MSDNEEENIATNGDLVLIDGSEEKHLVVSSSTLAAVSQVFKNLIGAQACTCQQCLHRQNACCAKSLEIKLPDDDATAMTQFCQALHLKYPAGLCSSTESYEFLEFAIVADKYDCSEALLQQSRGLLLRFLDQNGDIDSEKQLWDIVVASLLLRERHRFWRATVMIVMNTSANLLWLRKTRAGMANPLSTLVLAALQTKRTSVRYDLIEQNLSELTHCKQHTRTQQDKKLDQIASDICGTPTRWPLGIQAFSMTEISKELQELDGLELSCTECDWTDKLDFHDTFKCYALGPGICMWCTVGDRRLWELESCPDHRDWEPEIHTLSRVAGNGSRA